MNPDTALQAMMGQYSHVDRSTRGQYDPNRQPTPEEEFQAKLQTMNRAERRALQREVGRPPKSKRR